MDNKSTSNTHHEVVDENKRALLRNSFGAIAAMTIAGTAGLAEKVLAQEVQPVVSTAPTANISYQESALGIDYRTLAPSPLAEMLSHGEVEWCQNARNDYMEDTDGAWAEELVPQIASGAVSKFTIEELKRYTPEMLRSFSKLDHTDPKYGLLSSYGSLFISEQFSANT